MSFDSSLYRTELIHAPDLDVFEPDLWLRQIFKHVHVTPESERDASDILVWFITDQNTGVALGHIQECCEEVKLVEYHGDLEDLIGYPILQADCSCSVLPDTDEYSFNTARFYKFATVKGYVTFRFMSSTSGAYSDAVQMFRAHKGV